MTYHPDQKQLRKRRPFVRAISALALLATLFVATPQAQAQVDPHMPRNLIELQATPFAVQIAWDAPPSSVVGYSVFRDGQYQGFTAGPTWTDDFPIKGRTHIYGVGGNPGDGSVSTRAEIAVQVPGLHEPTFYFLDGPVLEVPEGAGTVRITIMNDTELNDPIPSDVSISVATEPAGADQGRDFYGGYEKYEIRRGWQDYPEFEITILDDEFDESDEEFVVRLFNPVNGSIEQGGHKMRVRIIDDDDGGDPDYGDVVVDMLPVFAGEGAVSRFVITAQHIPGYAPLPEDGFTVQFATRSGTAISGQDFYGKYQVVTFPPGVDRVEVPVTIIDDQIAEPLEYFHVRIWGPNNDRVIIGTAGGQVDVNDDD